MVLAWHRRSLPPAASPYRSWFIPTPQRCSLHLEVLEDRNLLSFAVPVNYPSGGNAAAVATGDFRGAGVLDLAVPNALPVNISAVSVLLANGDGTFQPAVAYPTGVNGPIQVVTGDFDNDGTLDIAALDQNNGEGHVSVLLGNGDGTFQAPVISPAIPNADAIAVGDFNGDGNLDVACASFNGIGNSGTVSILLGNGDGTFQAPYSINVAEWPSAIAAGDLNGDGTTDLVTANYGSGTGGSTVGILLGNGDGSFQPAVNYRVRFLPLGITLADLRGIGTLDIVTANQTNNVSVLLGNGDGTFQSSVEYNAGPYPAASVAVADFRGIGTLDLAVPVLGNHTVSVLLGNGNGSFQAPLSYPAGSGVEFVVAGDFNGDGFPDLATANYSDGAVAVLINQADWGPDLAPPRPPLPMPTAAPAATPQLASPVESVDQVMAVRFHTAPLATQGLLASTSGDPDQGLTSLPWPRWSGHRNFGYSWLIRSRPLRADHLTSSLDGTLGTP